jgi:uncharacterized protein
MKAKRISPKSRRKVLDFDAMSNSQLAKVVSIIAVVAIGLLWLFLGWISPPPQRSVVIAAGPSSGAYYQYALKYRDALSEHGIHADVLETNGTIDNLRLLHERGEGAADIAFVQAGPWQDQKPSPRALATVATEPLWILFDERHFAPKSLADLRGRRISVGKEGSGTLPVSRVVLELSGIRLSDIQAQQTNAYDALPALLAGEIDAVFTVAVASAPVIERAFAAGLQVLPLSNTVAFTRHLPWAQSATLAQGVISLSNNIPAEDVQMLAVKTNLVTKPDLHDSTKYLLLEVARQVHGQAGPLQTVREHPSAQGLIFKQDETSKQFFETGSPWLNRFLPFWSAHQMHRLLLSVLPVLVILLPLLKAAMLFNERRNKAAIMRLLIDAKELQFGHIQSAEPADDQQGLDLRPLKQKLLRLNPLTIHTADYYRIHESLAAIQADRLALQRQSTYQTAEAANTFVIDDEDGSAGDKPSLKIVPLTAERQAQPG